MRLYSSVYLSLDIPLRRRCVDLAYYYYNFRHGGYVFVPV